MQMRAAAIAAVQKPHSAAAVCAHSCLRQISVKNRRYFRELITERFREGLGWKLDCAALKCKAI